MTEWGKEVFEDVKKLVPSADLAEIKERRGGSFRFPIFINERLNQAGLENLDLSVRSSNCLHRAGYHFIGELVQNIDSRDDLRKIRNCGTKSVDEIIEHLFCYQYTQFSGERKKQYIRQLIELNQ